MNINTKKIIFIIGPTSIGKTKISIKIANYLKTEIISADSRQFFKELLIGTAPPNADELSKTKHHFIHNLSITENYNAGKYEIDVIKLIADLHKKYDTLIVVGGSGLYIDAICKGFDKMPPISILTRRKLNTNFNKYGLKWLQDQVLKIDPIFYKSCDINNPQRLLRALEVFQETKKAFSSYKTKNKKSRSFEIIKIGLNTERKLLYEKINKRVDLMIQNGLLEEVKSLKKHSKNNALQTVGYKELFSFLNNEISLDKAIENIKRNTRRFAKRQLTWFKKDQSIRWFKPDQEKEIIEFISRL